MHVTQEDLGSFDFTLRNYGIKAVPVMPCQSCIKHLDPAEADLVIVMGGPMGVYEADENPHLHDEVQFIQQRIALDKPTLGVCLGSQIIARALGARVYKGRQGKEIGFHPVSVNEAGMRTPLKYLDASETTVAHWHGDTFDLPEGATLLASSNRYAHQAFSYGNNTLAIQFHPEVTEVKLERWYARLPADIAEVGTSVPELRAAAHRHGAQLQQNAALFFTEWVGQVAPHLLSKRQQPAVEVA